MLFPQPELTAALPPRWTVERLTWLFVGIGVLVRMVRYGLAFPLWCDEFQLSANFLDRDFSQLLLPLNYNQVAPIGFLWIELAAVRLLGFSELSLRFFPALCGIASVFLFRHVARQLLRGVPLVLAVAVFSVAYYPIRHGAEVKPYSCDLFCALVLFSVALRWWRAPEQSRWLWLLAGLAPLALSISFAAAFIAGGLSLGIACTLWQQRAAADSRKGASAWLVFNLAVGVAFLGLMRLNVSAQYDSTQKEMTACWADGFPPWRDPLALIVWLAEVHTGPMFAYPFGAENGGSVATFFCFSVALIELFRRGRRDLALTITGWFALSMAAAALHRYPYGSHARLSQYLAPAICLLSGSGGALLLARLRDPRWQSAAVRLCLVGGGLLAGGMLIRDVTHPFKTRLDQDHRSFVRQFWTENPETLTVCVQTDLGLRFYDRSFETSYRCNQRICSPVHRGGPQLVRDRLARGDQPVRCVVFHSASGKRDEAAFASWMEEMLLRYELAATESHRLPLNNNRNHLYDYYLQCYDVYRFIPRGNGDSVTLPAPVARSDAAGPEAPSRQ
jgi:Dolichyl-phosphate-mannose-protein mannosyltransferase